MSTDSTTTDSTTTDSTTTDSTTTDEGRHEEGRLERAGGEPELYWQTWSPRAPRAPRGTLQLVHGLGEHSGRYDAFAARFVRAGWRVAAADLRGHGRSGGRRGHVEHFDDYGRDVAALAARFTDEAARPRVVYGHSMGGVVALRHVLDALLDTLEKGAPADRPDALVLSAPGLRAHPDATLPKPLHWAALGLARVTPRLGLPVALDPSTISRDPQVVEDYRTDPLIVSRVTPRWYVSFLAAQRDCFARAAALSVPTLLLVPTGDRLVDPEASLRFAAAVEAAGAGPITVRELDGLYHEPHHEPERDEVLGGVVDWLDERLPG